MIKIKKLLTSLAAIGLVASTSSMVVSCGPSFNKLENRKIDNSVYKTTFNQSIQNWNMAATMQSADYKILANLQESLMSFKEVGKVSPQIADIVKEKSDNTKITLKISDKAKWFKITDGSVVRNITANDIANTARYTLEPQNASEEVGDWKTLVKGAKDTFNEISSAEEQFAEGKISNDQLLKQKDDIFNKLIGSEDKPIYVNDANNEITITFAKPNNYFESVLAGGSFAPTPDEALSMGYAYGRSDYKNVLISGPYYMSEYRPSYMMKFKRNPNYELGSSAKGTIDTIEYLYSLNSDDASQRRLWEVGDITEAKLTPSDTYGYKHYKDFKGVSTQENNLAGLKYIDFNFSRHPDINNAPNEEDKNSNYALSLSSVRTLMAFALNRATLIQYFSGKDNVKDFITNTYNSYGYLKDTSGNDYVDLIQEKAGLGELQARDAYYQNLKLLDDEHVSDLSGLISKVKNDLSGHVTKKPKLTFLTSGANKNTFNPYIKKMIQDFNSIKDNPIEIVEKPTADDAEYQLTQTKGDYSMFITGSAPSYLDPMSFLIDLKINGKMSAYNGLSRLYSQDGKAIDSEFKEYNVSDSFKDSMNEINTAIETADNDSSTNRWGDFATAEVETLYKYKNVIPLYKPDGKEIHYLTYVDNSTRSNIGYGYNDYRLDGVKLYKSLKDYVKNKDNKNSQAIVKQN